MGHVKACWQLALLYEIGDGVPYSETQAIKYHKMASEKGWPPSQFFVACQMDISGLTTSEAAKLYRRATEAGEARATNNLSAHFFHVPVDAVNHGVVNQLSPQHTLRSTGPP